MLALLGLLVAGPGQASDAPAERAERAIDPSARLLSESAASEYWTLFVELDSGHRITQRFLLTNTGPGQHNAVAVGHLTEPGRAPYRYANGRRRPRWTLSEDRLFFDIAASHLDLHRPTGELRITKDDIEIRLFFELADGSLARRVPRERLPRGYHVDVLAIAAETRGSIHPPWMERPLEARGRTWLAHTWTHEAEASLIDRRLELYGHDNETAFYGIHLRSPSGSGDSWMVVGQVSGDIESRINVERRWYASERLASGERTEPYPIPGSLQLLCSEACDSQSGQIPLGDAWLRFDPLAVIPQPFRWFIRRRTRPHEVWADARIGGNVFSAPDTPPLPESGETRSAPHSKRETEDETANRGVTGVASITFLNPADRR